MTHPLYVAFIWHQHQPFYKSPIEGKYRLPWVRLHGTKDYLDMVLRLEQYPQLHHTVNLVPSLIEQIEDYVAGRAFDPYLELLLLPHESLKQSQLEFIIDRFFDAHYATEIEPHPRYRQLYQQREQEGKQWCLDHWQHQDYGDLVSWHNLVWFDPFFHGDTEIASWLEKQRGFTLGDRQRIYSKQRQILAQIVPQHAKMQATGQLELTTTPYSHPILPLLANEQSARVARPGLPLPRTPFRWEEDIPRHLQKSTQFYQERFHKAPRGLWPSEQSVSPAVLPHIFAEGFEWLVSDEGVLGCSLETHFHRDEMGHVNEGDRLYRPYRLVGEWGEMSIVFRDHRLSDLIGFSYGAMQAEEAVDDFVGHLLSVRQRLGGDEPWLVTVALDGENCWSYYPQDGADFLDTLYSRLSNTNEISCVTVSEYLDQFPATTVLPAETLHSGSWIEADFTTWIGDPVKNRAWELLAEARQTLANHPNPSDRAWDALMAAEGSDWFWWFGEGHSSSHDSYFDELFREHLKSLYQALGEAIPEVLDLPLDNKTTSGDCPPEGFIHPTITGQAAEEEWQQAGHLEVSGASGTMNRSSAVRKVWYGFDHFHLYLRFDFSTVQDRPEQLQIYWYYPDHPTYTSPIPLKHLPNHAPLNFLFRHTLQIDIVRQQVTFLAAERGDSWQICPHKIEMGLGECLEIAIPWLDMDIDPGQTAEFLAITATGNTFKEALPDQAVVAVVMP